jgi:hypothetical protein
VKKLLTVLIGITLIAGSATSLSAADIPDEQWSIMKNLFEVDARKTGEALLGLSIQDNTDLSERVSSMVGRAPGIAGDSGLRLCTSTLDIFCAPGNSEYLQAFIPVCKSASEINCIVGVSAIKDGVEMKGEYSRNFPEKGYTDFPADSKRNVPQGSTPSIWTFAGLNHGGGTNQYLASFVINGGFQPDGQVNFGSYYATLNAITVEAGQWGRNQARDASDPTSPACQVKCGMSMEGHSYNDKFVCASLDDGFCALRQAFPTGVRFKINARLSQSPTGWLHGRMKSPLIDISKISNGVSITIEAEPVTVPVVGVLEKYNSLPSSMKLTNQNRGGFTWGNAAPDGRKNVIFMPSPDSQDAFDALQDWKEYIKDKANATPSEWAVRSLADSGDVARCFKSSTELVGIVTTNSMVYLGKPPVFDKDNQSLDYKVASPHYTSKGDVFKGTYDLQLKSDVARCLYGFSNAPISAKISIISESGEANVATTVVNEKDGWLRMAAYGFTFSSPTLKVKLTQPSTSGSLVVKKTITCVKGKTTKKVTAVNPKCPSGYKKKG